ncbi:hypothetical protein ACS0TY_014918 [Phlomoides rotata]
MGELKVVNPNGSVPIEENPSGLGRNSSSPPDPALITDECLSAAEEAAEQVLNCVHPTLDSEEKRRDVLDYVQQLVKTRLNCESVSYGSLPLKTYLPDGDIDLTILKGPNAEESLANDVLSLLEEEEQSQNAEFQVKDTQFIDAEVKLVKCLVQNIVVDITFNQLGGISTLCFLEQVDRLVGRNHLFKRSIILVKTWCYYESRILGAHHGLLSTYALETLVLYIFHFFHSSLSGPLAVLYRFLDYYSRFDWEKYCISLKGPVHKSSLPNIVVKMPENGRNSVLLGEEFLENCMELFSVPCKVPEANTKAFQPKHLNIIDPMKENNNLGRSVHRGNFYRIRSAFKYGALKLGQLLLRPRDNIAEEILKFFSNTRAMHEHHQQSSKTRHLVLEFSDQDSFSASLSSPVELFSDDGMPLKSSASDFDNDSVCFEQAPILESGSELDRYSMREVSPETASEAWDSVDGFFISGHSMLGGKCLLSHPNSHTENGCLEDQRITLADSERFDFNLWLKNREEHLELNKNKFLSCLDDPEVVGNGKNGFSSTLKAHILENLSFDYRDIDAASVGEESEASDPLADLTGDYHSNIRSLLSAQLCHGFALSAAPPVPNRPSSSPSRIQNKKPQDIFCRSMSLKENEFSQKDTNIMSTNHIMCADSDSALLSNGFHFQGTQKSRGLGTYFPNMTAYYMEKALQWRGRYNHKHLDTHHNNGFYSGGSNSFENGMHEVVPTQKRFLGRRKSDVQCQSPRTVRGGNQINGCLDSSSRIEFGSIGKLAEEMISASANVRCSTTLAPLKQTQNSVMTMRDRVAGEFIHLKNEDEFPPLC